jgi:hypothetical protein
MNPSPTPVTNKIELLQLIKHIHVECYKLCKQSFNKYLENSGNIGIFCHYENEYAVLTSIRRELTEPSDNPDQKYFELISPIHIAPIDDIPETIYTHLYIRKPDPTPYGLYVGDIDFYLSDVEYDKYKAELLDGKDIKGARIYDRPDLDMIQLHDPNIDAVAYVSKKTMTDAVRIKQSDITNL